MEINMVSNKRNKIVIGIVGAIMMVFVQTMSMMFTSEMSKELFAVDGFLVDAAGKKIQTVSVSTGNTTNEERKLSGNAHDPTGNFAAFFLMRFPCSPRGGIDDWDDIFWQRPECHPDENGRRTYDCESGHENWRYDWSQNDWKEEAEFGPGESLGRLKYNHCVQMPKLHHSEEGHRHGRAHAMCFLRGHICTSDANGNCGSSDGLCAGITGIQLCTPDIVHRMGCEAFVENLFSCRASVLAGGTCLYGYDNRAEKEYIDFRQRINDGVYWEKKYGADWIDEIGWDKFEAFVEKRLKKGRERWFHGSFGRHKYMPPPLEISGYKPGSDGPKIWQGGYDTPYRALEMQATCLGHHCNNVEKEYTISNN